MAGLEMLKGTSRPKALRAAGFAQSTIASSTRNGLTEFQCVKQAVRAFPKVDPAKLAEKARRVMELKLDEAIGDDGNGSDSLKKAQLSEVARIVEVSERHFGGSVGEGVDGGRSFADRLLFLQALIERLGERRAAELAAVESADDGVEGPE
jgi:hypothetical protein